MSEHIFFSLHTHTDYITLYVGFPALLFNLFIYIDIDIYI